MPAELQVHIVSVICGACSAVASRPCLCARRHRPPASQETPPSSEPVCMRRSCDSRRRKHSTCFSAHHCRPESRSCRRVALQTFLRRPGDGDAKRGHTACREGEMRIARWRRAAARPRHRPCGGGGGGQKTRLRLGRDRPRAQPDVSPAQTDTGRSEATLFVHMPGQVWGLTNFGPRSGARDRI